MKNVVVDEALSGNLGELITALLAEDEANAGKAIPDSAQERWEMFRALLISRPPRKAEGDFVDKQDDLLQTVISDTGVTNARKMTPVIELGESHIFLWQGDIAALRIDCMANPTTADMLGCFDPTRDCIDNDVHTFGGVQLRSYMSQIAEMSGDEFMVTFGNNLPSVFVINVPAPKTAGGAATAEELQELERCYQTTFELADIHDCRRLALPLLGLEENGYTLDETVKVAVDVVKRNLDGATGRLHDVFFVAADDAERIAYEKALGL